MKETKINKKKFQKNRKLLSPKNLYLIISTKDIASINWKENTVKKNGNKKVLLENKNMMVEISRRSIEEWNAKVDEIFQKVELKYRDGN